MDGVTIESWLIWGCVIAISAAIVIAHFRAYRRQDKQNRSGKREAVELKIDRPPAQHPMIDLSLCIGCGSCVRACPEGGVLGLVGGKATIINGLRCVGHGKCAEACPVEAVRIGMGDLSQREDIPNCDEDFQSNIPGIFIVGELGGLALIKNAIRQGEAVIEAIAKDLRPAQDARVHDIVIVGAGPAGLSAALSAKRAGFSCLILEQEEAGGTILQYPRRKMMLTQPVNIPLYGWLKKSQYAKEELLSIWYDIIESHQINIAKGVVLQDISACDGFFELTTTGGSHYARRVVLALGRRGTPRKLDVPGEDKAKVMYKLIDAADYEDEDLLVVGGGDSAIEAAIALSRQPCNRVTISYRKPKIFRVKQKNQQLLENAISEGRVRVIFNSNVLAIEDDRVQLDTEDGPLTLPNGYVFVFAGGVPPFGVLKKIGIAFGSAEKSGSQTPPRTNRPGVENHVAV